MNGDISKLFHYIKAHGQQPGRQLFCLPSALASFTSFALRLAFGVVQGCRSPLNKCIVDNTLKT